MTKAVSRTVHHRCNVHARGNVQASEMVYICKQKSTLAFLLFQITITGWFLHANNSGQAIKNHLKSAYYKY
jgi:hypothetical protein